MPHGILMPDTVAGRQLLASALWLRRAPEERESAKISPARQKQINKPRGNRGTHTGEHTHLLFTFFSCHLGFRELAGVARRSYSSTAALAPGKVVGCRRSTNRRSAICRQSQGSLFPEPPPLAPLTGQVHGEVS